MGLMVQGTYDHWITFQSRSQKEKGRGARNALG